MQRLIDIYIVFQFVKKLTTPFAKTDAFKRGIIDDKGNVLRPYKLLKDPKDKAAWTWLDILINNLKRLMAKLPGGQSALFTYAMSFFLLREPISKLRLASRFGEAELKEAVLAASADKYLSEAAQLVPESSGILTEQGVGLIGQGKLPEQDTFAGCRVFVVDSETFRKCRLGKKRYARYEQYVGSDLVGQSIREYGKTSHSRRGIILVDEKSGAMIYLKFPRTFKHIISPGER